MGKRIVLATTGSLGDLHPYLAVGLGLKSRGHRVAIATCEFYRPRVEGIGLEFRPVRPHFSPEDPEIVRAAIDVRNGTKNVFRILVSPHVRGTYEDTLRAVEGADLAISHPLTLTIPMIAEKTGLPWASSVLAPLSFLSVHEPAVAAGYPVVSWFARRGRWLRTLILAGGKAVTRRWIRPVLDLREELGLPPGGHPLAEGQHSPRLVLALFSSVLARPQPDWPPNTVVTGACFHDRKEGHETLPPALARFLETGPPPLVFTLGSSAILDAGRFFEESASAARELGRRAVLVTGKDRPAGLAGPDLCVVEYAPYSLLFPGAAAIVCSAGIGTLGQALRAGRPFVAIPYGNDQPDNAARCERLGVSRTIAKAKYRRDRAARTLAEILSNGEMSGRAREIAGRVNAEGGVRAACDALERLLAEPTSRAP